MRETAPTRIVDRNGKITTVHKRPDNALEKSFPGIPAPVTQPVVVDIIRQKRERIESVLQYLSTPENKVSLQSLGSMSLDQFESTATLLDSHPSRSLVDMIETRSIVHQAGFTKWLKGMAAIATNSTIEVSPTLGDTVAGIVELQDNCGVYSDLTSDQYCALARLSIAASEPEVDFGLQRHARSAYGRITQQPDADLLEFVLYQTEDIVARATEEIERKNLTRKSELEAFLEGDLPTAMVSGVL